MAEYEMVREIQNGCANSQLRDVAFQEIETDDPVAYVKGMLGEKGFDEISCDSMKDGEITVYVSSGGIRQKFLFTLL